MLFNCALQARLRDIESFGRWRYEASSDSESFESEHYEDSLSDHESLESEHHEGSFSDCDSELENGNSEVFSSAHMEDNNIPSVCTIRVMHVSIITINIISFRFSHAVLDRL